MKVVGIIQARMSSTRFPGKTLKPLAGKPVIWHLIHRLKKSKTLDKIVIAISENPADDPLEKFALAEGVDCFRGSEENVLLRYHEAAMKVKADVVVRITGDAPLIDPDWLDYLVKKLLSSEADWVRSDPLYQGVHEGFSPVTARVLQRLVTEAGDNPVAREHVTGYLEQNPGFAPYITVKARQEHIFEGVRISVDTPADLEFLEEVYRRLSIPAGEIDIKDFVALLKKTPELLYINSHVRQKTADDKTRMILFRCDGDQSVGFGHFYRCLALADILRESYGYGITFAMAHGRQGFDLIRQAGYALAIVEEGNEEKELDNLIKNSKPAALVFDNRNHIDAITLEGWRNNNILIVTIDDPTEKRLAADLAFYPPVPQVGEMNWDGFRGDLFTGWEWVLLRRQFLKEKAGFVKPKERIPLLITMGGSDPHGLTCRAIEAVNMLDGCLEVAVLIGPGFRDEKRAGDLTREGRHKYRVYRSVEKPVELFSRAEMAIASFGVTAYELAACGVPALLVSISEDHALSASIFADAGIAVSLGLFNDISNQKLADAANKLLKDASLRKEMAERSTLLVDAKGAVRIAQKIYEKVESESA